MPIIYYRLTVEMLHFEVDFSVIDYRKEGLNIGESIIKHPNQIQIILIPKIRD